MRGCDNQCPAAPSHSTKETEMKTLYSVIIAGLLGFITTTAFADDLPAANAKAAKPQTGVITTAASPGPVKISQQDKMRLCSKQATGKKGADRKTFMKGCLSNKA
jgi:psiF repeat